MHDYYTVVLHITIFWHNHVRMMTCIESRVKAVVPVAFQFSSTILIISCAIINSLQYVLLKLPVYVLFCCRFLETNCSNYNVQSIVTRCFKVHV